MASSVVCAGAGGRAQGWWEGRGGRSSNFGGRKKLLDIGKRPPARVCGAFSGRNRSSRQSPPHLARLVCAAAKAHAEVALQPLAGGAPLWRAQLTPKDCVARFRLLAALCARQVCGAFVRRLRDCTCWHLTSSTASRALCAPFPASSTSQAASVALVKAHVLITSGKGLGAARAVTRVPSPNSAATPSSSRRRMVLVNIRVASQRSSFFSRAGEACRYSVNPIPPWNNSERKLKGTEGMHTVNNLSIWHAGLAATRCK